MSQDHDANANEQGWDGQSVYGPSTVIAALDQIEDLVESARSIPLSASIMVNKAEILDLSGGDASPARVDVKWRKVADAPAKVQYAAARSSITTRRLRKLMRK